MRSPSQRPRPPTPGFSFTFLISTPQIDRTRTGRAAPDREREGQTMKFLQASRECKALKSLPTRTLMTKTLYIKIHGRRGSRSRDRRGKDQCGRFSDQISY